MKLKAIFRTFRGDTEATALFPEVLFDHSGHCMCYARVGQHGAADYEGCIERSRPSTPEQTARLKAELESLGYEIEVHARATRAMHIARWDELAKTLQELRARVPGLPRRVL